MTSSHSSSSARQPFDVGVVVHELNNALAPIIMSVELLRRKVADPDAQRQLDLVAGHAWRGAAVARRMLAWSESRAGVRARIRPKKGAKPRRG